MSWQQEVRILAKVRIVEVEWEHEQTQGCGTCALFFWAVRYMHKSDLRVDSWSIAAN